MTSFKDWLSKSVAPGFLRRKWGSRLIGTVGFVLDILFDDATLAVKSRMPLLCPDDALGYVGDMRNIEKYRAESLTTYRGYVYQARLQWQYAGIAGDAAKGIANKLGRMGYAVSSIVGWPEASTLTPGPPSPYETWWSAFWVVIYPSPLSRRHWGDSGLKWGMTAPSPIGNPDAMITWGSNANSVDVLELRKALRKWRPAHEISAHVIFKLLGGADIFDTTDTIRIGAR